MKKYYFISLLLLVLLSSCSNDKEKIIGKWVNYENDPPPTTLTITINNNIISVQHDWRLEYHEHINGGSWLSTGSGNETFTHATYEDHYMRVDGSYMEFSKDFTSLTWKEHTYYKLK